MDVWETVLKTHELLSVARRDHFGCINSLVVHVGKSHSKAIVLNFAAFNVETGSLNYVWIISVDVWRCAFVDCLVKASSWLYLVVVIVAHLAARIIQGTISIKPTNILCMLDMRWQFMDLMISLMFLEVYFWIAAGILFVYEFEVQIMPRRRIIIRYLFLVNLVIKFANSNCGIEVCCPDNCISLSVFMVDRAPLGIVVHDRSKAWNLPISWKRRQLWIMLRLFGDVQILIHNWLWTEAWIAGNMDVLIHCAAGHW